VVIDKDQAPNWRPARLEDVTDDLVASHFAPPAGGDLILASRSEMQALQP
jgi:enoyl-CoA hydratase